MGGALPAATPVEGSLGAFQLDCVVASGAMGTVLRGAHRRSGLPVAIKVLDAARAADRSLRDELIGEARRVAAIDHPHVVRVLDLGQVDPGALRVAGAPIASGSPYVVMEFASRGTLAAAAPLGWPDLRRVLLALLDALGHAHAHDLVHLDLKPANVLLGCDRGDGTGGDLVDGLRLADFGISWLRHSGGRAAVTGTPSYMAPEQIRGDLVRFGPWTDLYSLGCMAWQLATGRPPHKRDGSVGATLRAHLSDELPPFTPRGAVPEGLGVWLTRLLAVAPRERPWSAAEAAESLRELRGPVGAGGSVDGPADDDEPTVAVARDASAPTGGSTRPLVPRARAVPTFAPPIRRFRAPQPIADAGLALVGLRDPSLVGRDQERAVCWRAFRRVALDGSAHVLVLVGAHGRDPWRLGRWLRIAACELGLAWGHPVPEGDGSAFRALARSLLPVQSAPTGGQARWLFAGAEPSEQDELATAVVSAAFDDAPLRGDPTSLLLRTAAVVARGRPLLLEGPAASVARLAECEEFLGRARAIRAPVLWVVSVTGEAAGEGGPLARLRQSRAATVVDVPELDPGALEEALRSVLPLSPSATLALAQRFQGDLEAALSQLALFSRRGELVPSPDGFVRDGGSDAAPVDDVDTWRALLGSVAVAPAQRTALALGAVLGAEIDVTDWAGVLALADVAVDAEALVGRLFEARLALGTRSRFRWVHSDLRALLLLEARVAGREAQTHLLAAGWFAAHPARDPTGERQGRHLLEAGAVEAGAPLILAAASAALDRGALREAALLEEPLRASLTSRPGQLRDVLWRTWAVLRLRLLTASGAYRERLELAEALIEAAVACDAVGHRLRGEVHRINSLQILGRNQEAQAHLAAAVAEPNPPIDEAVDLTILRAYLHIESGEFERGQQVAQRAWELARTGASPRALAQVAAAGAAACRRTDRALQEAWLTRLEEALVGFPGGGLRVNLLTRRFLNAVDADLAAAWAHAPALLRTARSVGALHLLAQSLNEVAALALALGRVDEAREMFGEADELFSAIGTQDRVTSLAGLVGLACREGRGDKLDHCRRQLEALGEANLTPHHRLIRAWGLLLVAVTTHASAEVAALVAQLEAMPAAEFHSVDETMSHGDRAALQRVLDALRDDGLGLLADRLAALYALGG